jgi:sugar (pentulose or hexulose) kinase
MREACTVVLDVGKTHAKLTLWTRTGAQLARRTRANVSRQTSHYCALDTAGIETWLEATLQEFSTLGAVTAIVPVAHGAGAAVIRDGALACPPLDYEQAIPDEVRMRYLPLRDPFASSGSPPLPAGLNLGLQLYWLEELYPGLLDGDAAILPWAQYWAWLLAGVAAAEVTSLGCHTDLWRPREARPSGLAIARGWARRLAPLRHAADVLGLLTPAWVLRTGLPPETKILCGLHDSNAALLDARGYREIAGQEATLISTGTWFVAMRSPAADSTAAVPELAEQRDCLLNVDVQGRPVPTARFMGGRELELLGAEDQGQSAPAADQARLVEAAQAVIRSGAMVLPTLAPGVGPYPRARFRWQAMPAAPDMRCAAAALYAALMMDASLSLLDARERILIEGRFAESAVFTRALAALRPDCSIYVTSAHDGVACGARRLIDPKLPPSGLLRRVAPLDAQLGSYQARWRSEAERLGAAA